MRLIISIFAILLQCATQSSFAARGHTINNGGNLAEIRFTDAWQNLERTMAPCLTPANLCGLSPAELSLLKAAVLNKPAAPATPPAGELLYHADGSAKEESEMYAVVLMMLQDCGGSLVPASLENIGARATEITDFAQVKLSSGKSWYVFQRGGLWLEDVAGVQSLSPKFRDMLRLAGESPLSFDEISVRNKDGIIEIGGRVLYARETQRSGGFTLLIRPLANGGMPASMELLVFR